MSESVTVLAFDLGASSGRAVIGRLEKGEGGAKRLSIEEIHRFPNEPVQVGNHLHWDILRLLHEIKTGIRKAVRQAGNIESFGIDSWAVDFGLLDENGELLGNPYHYRDSHTNGIMEEVCEKVGKERLFAESGLMFMPFNTVYQLYAMKKARSVQLAQAKALLMIPDLLLYQLTGVKTAEFTNATTTQLIRPDTRTWNTALLEALGLPQHVWQPPVQPGTLVGQLSAAVCQELDVPPIPAIAVATHDTASAVAAVPAQSSPFAYLSSGTWSLLGTELPRPALSPEALAWNFTNEGGVNGTYRLLKNIMGLWLIQECKRHWDAKGETHSFAELVRQAEAVPAFACLIDPDDARFLHPHRMPEKIQDYCRESGQQVPQTKGEIVRCILESLACQYRVALERTEALASCTFDKLHMVGGGIQNELLCQMTASAIARPVWAGPVEGSAIGNVLVQLIAHGAFADLQEARHTVAASFPHRIYMPQDRELWEQADGKFRSLLSRGQR